jgi:hypothetical protein
MRIYLDNCVLNRPFDDQSQLRIRLETNASLQIRNLIESNSLELVWSYFLDYEISRNPFVKVRNDVREWKSLASIYITPTASIVTSGNDLLVRGLKPIDSLHVSAAHYAKCAYFISTDDGILSKLNSYRDMTICDPTSFLVDFCKL